MTPDPVQITRELIRDLHPIHLAITDLETILSELRDLIPPRGELPDKIIELADTINRIHDVYHQGNERLIDAYHVLEHTQRVPNPKPLTDAA